MNLQERIDNKEKQIAKMERNLVKYFVSDEFTQICDRFFISKDRTELENYKKQNDLWYLPEYYSKRYELEDAKATLAKYYKQLQAEKLVIDMINRTIAITGKIVGEKSSVKIESIGAGGYNIQRYHIRVLVKKVK